MKKLSTLIAASFLSLTLVACVANKGKGGGGGGGGGLPETYTVAFNLDDGTRHATLFVEENQHIDQSQVADPIPAEGFVFDGWFDNDYKLDFETYVVTHDVTFTAHFLEDEEPDPYPDLDVNAVKEADHTYYLVFGWWEALNEDGTSKGTSGLITKDAKLIYANLLTYLRATDTSEANIANVQFRNYSSLDVAAMCTAVKADADVDILFGVGNNVNSAGNLSLNHSDNAYKFAETFGTGQKSRYVANLSYSTERGEEIYLWLKNTDCGRKALNEAVTTEEVEASLAVVIDLTVRVHGTTVAETHFDSAQGTVDISTVEAPEGYHLVGFATEEDGEVALNKVTNIEYNDVKDLTDGNTLDLYPVFEENVVAEEDLVVYIQVNGSNLTMAEAGLLEARFKETAAAAGKDLRFTAIDAAADTFKTTVEERADADVLVGGNNPLNNMGKHESGPTANAGTKHFNSTNRKTIISNTVNSDHLELATAFYNFVKADAPQFEVHTTFWPKSDKSWVTDEERAAAVTGVRTQLNTYFALGEGKTLEDTYNIQLTFVDVNVEGNKVADLGAATNALREGKGTDLIIGCGKNVKSTGLVNDVEHKQVDASFLSQGERYISLVRENVLTRYIYDNLYLIPEVVEG